MSRDYRISFNIFEFLSLFACLIFYASLEYPILPAFVLGFVRGFDTYFSII
jgi:hypothetical protein